MSASRRINRESLAYWGIVAIAVGIYATIEWLMPLRLDDWDFMRLYRETAGTDSFSFGGLLNYGATLREVENGRIANFLSPFSTLFSPWREAFPLFTGLMVGLMLASGERMSRRYGTAAGRLPALALLWLLLLVSLPWKDNIFVADYALNYIWGAGITLLTLYLLIRTESAGWSLPSLCLLTLLAVVAGGWHEGFAIPSVAGLLLLALTRRLRMTWQFYAVTAIYLLSALFFFITPGMMERATEVVGRRIEDIWSRGYMRNYYPVAGLLLTVIVLACFRGGRRALARAFSNPFLIIGIGVMAAGYAIGLNSTQKARTFFWADVFACIEFVAIMRCLWPWGCRLWHQVAGAGAFAAVTICVVQGITAIVWTDRYRHEFDAVYPQISEGSPTVFYDVMPPGIQPHATLGMSPYWMWGHTDSFLWESADVDFAGVVPVEMRQADISRGIPYGGDSGIVRVGRHLIAPYRAEKEKERPIIPRLKYFTATYSDGREGLVGFDEVPFVTLPFPHTGGEVKSDTLYYYYNFYHDPLQWRSLTPFIPQ